MSNTFYFCNMFSWGSLTLFCGALFVSVVSTEKLHPSTNPTNRKAKRRSLTKGKRRTIRRCARGFGRGPGGSWICLYKVAFLTDGAMGKITIFHPPFGRICQRNLFQESKFGSTSNSSKRRGPRGHTQGIIARKENIIKQLAIGLIYS